jgi:hypothetical protein
MLLQNLNEGTLFTCQYCTVVDTGVVLIAMYESVPSEKIHAFGGIVR